jgi:hypothetical protein
MKKSIILITLISLISIGFVMAQTVSISPIPSKDKANEICMKYENFNGQNLSLNKWSESGTMDEYNLDTNSKNWHTQQNNHADRTAKLNLLNHDFKPGESIKYQMDYKNQSGNAGSFISIDGLTDYWLPIGYWSGCGGLPNTPHSCPAGNETGIYKIKVDFYQGSYNVTIKNPNGTWIPITNFPQIVGATHTVGFGTRTGGNGIVHFDYDNVQICRRF